MDTLIAKSENVNIIFFVRQHHSRAANARVVATNKNGVVSEFSTASIVSTGVEFIIPAEYVVKENLPAQVDLIVDGMTVREIELIPAEATVSSEIPDYLSLENLDVRFVNEIDTNAFATDLEVAALVRDQQVLTRLESKTANGLRRLGARAAARAWSAKSGMIKEDWTNLTTNAWTNTATPATLTGNRLVSGGVSKNISLAPGERFLARVEVTINSTAASRSTFIGLTNTAGVVPNTDNNGLYIGFTGTAPQVAAFKGSGVSGNPGVAPSTAGPGTYLVTIIVDEETISMSIQKRASNPQNIFAFSMPRAAMPGGTGAITQFGFSTTSTGASEHSIGPVFFWKESQPPFAEDRVVGGIDLWGTGNPTLIHKVSPASGIRHIYKLPGNYDPRVGSPVISYMHQATTGSAVTPYSESRWTEPITKIENAGYALISSDNGLSGNFDKVGNQDSVDDYAAAIRYFSEHFNTESRFILAISQGGYPMHTMLKQRNVGAINAVIGVSPGYDLAATISTADPALKTVLHNAYGASDDADFLVKSAPYDPAKYPASATRAVPMRLYYATNDTVTPKEIHHDPLVSKLRDFGIEVEEVNKGAVGHVAAAMHNGDEWIEFFEKHRVV